MIIKPIHYYDDYYATDCGNILSTKHGKLRVLKQNYCKTNNSYSVSLYKDGEERMYSVHRLIASSFYGERDSKIEVNHIDGDRSNNVLENLEWCTRSENLRHAYEIGLRSSSGESNGNSKLTREQVREIKWLIEQGFKNKYIHEQYNFVSYNTISAIRCGDCWNNVQA